MRSHKPQARARQAPSSLWRGCVVFYGVRSCPIMPDRYPASRHPPEPEDQPRARCSEPPPSELLVAVEQFNQRDYFECHETLEHIWNAEPGVIRVLYKGILQVGVGCFHLLRHNYRGAVLKLQTGADYLEPFAPTCRGVDVARL